MRFSEEEIRQRLPDPKIHRLMYVQLKVSRLWKDRFGFAFRDLVARCLVAFNINHEEIRDNLAVLHGNGVGFCLKPDEAESRIMIVVHRDYDHELANIRSKLSDIAADLSADFKNIEAKLFLQSPIKTIGSAELIQEARKSKDSLVMSKSEQSVSVVQFNPFFDFVEYKFDAFLAYDQNSATTLPEAQTLRDLVPLLEAKGLRI